MDEAQNQLTYHWGQYFQCCRDTEFEQRVRLTEVPSAERAARTLSPPAVAAVVLPGAQIRDACRTRNLDELDRV